MGLDVSGIRVASVASLRPAFALLAFQVLDTLAARPRLPVFQAGTVLGETDEAGLYWYIIFRKHIMIFTVSVLQDIAGWIRVTIITFLGLFFAPEVSAFRVFAVRLFGFEALITERASNSTHQRLPKVQ